MNHQEQKERLLQEKQDLVDELSSVARKNPDKEGDWEAVEENFSDQTTNADPNVVADEIEEFDERTAVTRELEARLSQVEKALKAIEEGTYGKCEVCGKIIQPERLEANPAATTCIDHA